MTEALRLDRLTKRFGDHLAVDSVSLSVPAGSFYGVVGPNGAGKTTCLSMATGMLRPDDGTSHLFGVDVWADPAAAKQLVGILPDGLGLPERFTGREALTYLGLLRGLPTDQVATRGEELLEVLDLPRGRTDDRLVAEYSTGMRKKIGLAIALLHAPRLLVLDEPFEAVDPVSAATVKTILRRFVDTGGSVVLSSHVMALVEQLCDHVAVIDEGRVRTAGTLDSVREGGSLEEAFVRLSGGVTVPTGTLAWLSR